MINESDESSVLDFFNGWNDNTSGKHVTRQDIDTVFTCPDCKYQHKSHEWKHAFCVNCDALLS